MNTPVFTTTFDRNLLAWVDSETKIQAKTRRDVLESAVRLYKRERMREGFLKAAQDADILEMAEWGMREFATDTLA